MKGFTLIEVIISISISLLVVGAVIVNYNGYNDTQTLKQTGLTLKNNLRFAQVKALTGEKPSANCTKLSGYQVTFAAGGYSIQATCEPEGLTGDITAVTFPTITSTNSLQFSPVPSPIIFYVVSRGTNLNTAVSLRLAGFGKAYAIQVSPGGDMNDLGLQ